MLPTLSAGDMVRLEVLCGLPKRGDVVALSLAGTLLIHRVITAADDGVKCRGDNRVTCDPTVPVGAIIGRAVEIVPGRPIPSGALVRARFDARAAGRRAAALSMRGARELRLLANDVRGQPSPWRRRPCAGAAGPRPRGFDAEATVITPEAALDLVDGEAGTPDARPAEVSPQAQGRRRAAVIPASVYSSLSLSGRRRLLTRLGVTDVLVWACSLGDARLPVRLLARARRWVAEHGGTWGTAGDAVVDPGGGPTVVHFFTEAELLREVHECGYIVDALARARVGDSPLLGVWARRPPSA